MNHDPPPRELEEERTAGMRMLKQRMFSAQVSINVGDIDAHAVFSMLIVPCIARL
jgi:hypothetical protein